MPYHIKHITLIAVVGIMLCLVMAACSDSNAEDAISMNDVRVAFTLAVADVRTTRAANEGWDDYDHSLPGIEKENMINPDDLYIAICDKGGNIIGDVNTIKVVPMSDPSDNKYAITGVWRMLKTILPRLRR